MSTLAETNTESHVPQLRIPRKTTVLRMLINRVRDVTKHSLPVRSPRLRNTDYGYFYVWSLGYADSQEPFISRLLKHEAKTYANEHEKMFFSPQWPWYSHKGAVLAEAQRIAKRYRVTFFQQDLIAKHLVNAYGFGHQAVGSDGGFLGLVGDIEGVHRDPRIYWELKDSLGNEEFSLAAILDPVVTSLILLYFAMETVKCASRKQSLN